MSACHRRMTNWDSSTAKPRWGKWRSSLINFTTFHFQARVFGFEEFKTFDCGPILIAVAMLSFSAGIGTCALFFRCSNALIRFDVFAVVGVGVVHLGHVEYGFCISGRDGFASRSLTGDFLIVSSILRSESNRKAWQAASMSSSCGIEPSPANVHS